MVDDRISPHPGRADPGNRLHHAALSPAGDLPDSALGLHPRNGDRRSSSRIRSPPDRPNHPGGRHRRLRAPAHDHGHSIDSRSSARSRDGTGDRGPGHCPRRRPRRIGPHPDLPALAVPVHPRPAPRRDRPDRRGPEAAKHHDARARVARPVVAGTVGHRFRRTRSRPVPHRRVHVRSRPTAAGDPHSDRRDRRGRIRVASGSAPSARRPVPRYAHLPEPNVHRRHPGHALRRHERLRGGARPPVHPDRRARARYSRDRPLPPPGRRDHIGSLCAGRARVRPVGAPAPRHPRCCDLGGEHLVPQHPERRQQRLGVPGRLPDDDGRSGDDLGAGAVER